MGRTLPPFSQLIEAERRAWAPFRRALRKDDQVAFDHLFDCAKLHVQAGAYQSRPWPFEVIAMAILLEHHKRLERLLAQIEAVDGPAHTAPGAAHDPPVQLSMLTDALPSASDLLPPLTKGSVSFPLPPGEGEKPSA